MNQENVDTKKKKKFSASTLFICIVLLAVSGWFLYRAWLEFDQMKELKSDIAKAEAMLAEIKQENIELLEQRDKLEDPEYVKSYARGIYMLSKEGEQIFYLPSEDDTKQ